MKSFTFSHKQVVGSFLATALVAMIPLLFSSAHEQPTQSSSEGETATIASFSSMMMCTDARPITRWNRMTDLQVSALNDNDPLTNVAGFHTGFCNGMVPVTVDISVTGSPSTANPSNINNRFSNRWGLTSFNNGREAAGNSGNKYCFTFSEPVAFTVNSNEHRFFHDSENIKVTAFDNANAPMMLSGSLNGPVGPATISGNGTTLVSFAGNLKRGTGVWWEVNSAGNPAKQICVEYYKTGPGQGFYGREPFTLSICDLPRCLFDDPIAAADPANPNPMAPIADRLSFTKTLHCTNSASSGVVGNVDATFRMTLTNQGDNTLTNLQIEDDLADHIPTAALVGVLGVQFGPGNNALMNPTLNPSFTGISSVRIFNGSDGMLMPGQSLVIDLEVELDPSQLTAYESITNQAFGYGQDASMMFVSAASDAPAGQPGNTVNGLVDGLLLRIPSINMAKYATLYNISPSCNAAGEVECTYRMVMMNTGNIRLDNISLIENLNTQFGGVLVGLVAPPSISASTATLNPAINPNYNGVAPNNNIFTGNTGRLDAGQRIEVSLRLRLDPNSPLAANPLQNQAFVAARGVDTNNAPFLGCVNNELVATDNSDSGTVPDGANNLSLNASLDQHNDILPILLMNMGAAKSIVSFGPAASQIPGNLDVRFRVVMKNTGNVGLTNLQLSDNLPSMLGAAYVGITTPPSIVASTATLNPNLGVFPNNIFNGTTGQLDPNQTITVEFVAEMNPDAPGLTYPLKNRMTLVASGQDPTGTIISITQFSDGGTDPESINAGAAGDTGCSNDFLAVQIPAIRVAKHFAGIDCSTSGAPGNFDVITEVVVQNVGSMDLTSLGLLENLASPTNLGPAFVAITQSPHIVATGAKGSVTNATVAPGINPAFNGNGDMLNGTGLLKPGQTYVLQFRFEVNPDAPGAPMVMKNQVTANGIAPGPNNMVMVASDLSDEGYVPQSTNSGYLGDSGGTDDPTLLSNCWNLMGNGLSCNDLVQVSLNQQCQIGLTTDMVLEGEYNICSNPNTMPLGTYYEVLMVTDDWGTPVPDLNPATPNVHEISGAFIGQYLTVKIRDKVYKNSCWGQIFIEDKMAPAFNCPSAPVQVNCTANLANVPAPTATDNCDPHPVVALLGQQTIDNNICDDGVYRIRRTYKATDNQGNMSVVNCVQNIDVVRPPVDFPNDITWHCSQYDAFPTITNATAVHPNVTDVDPVEPGIDVSPLLSNTALSQTGSGIVNVSLNNICSYQVLHSDQPTTICGESFKIIRTWTVIDWCTGDFVTIGVGGEDNVQVIKIADKVAPEIARAPFNVSSNVPAVHPQPCRSTGLLLPPTVSDNCNTVTVQIITPVGEADYIGADGTMGGFIPSPGLPLGTHQVTYIATDACGNSKTINVPVTVVDDITPAPVCLGVTDVSIPSTGSATVLATSFNTGSSDNCCIHHFEVRRMTDPCADGHDDTVFGPSVVFCCADVANSPIMVVFRAFDCNGNFNDCMVTVEVEDKIPPVLVSCPPNQRITCDVYADNYETQLAALGNNQMAKSQFLDPNFGQPVFTDNCSMTVGRTFSTNINQCKEGSLTRTWTATDPQGQQSGTCTQTIFVDHVSDFAVTFPQDITVNCGQNLPNFGEPVIFNKTCEMVATSFSDGPFEVVPGACYKIVRTWVVTNWCVQGIGNPAVDQEVVEVPESMLGVPFPQCDVDGDGDCDSRTFRDSWNVQFKPSAVNATNTTGPDTDLDSDPWDGYITYQQVIKVIDAVAPVITSCALPDVCITGTTCSATFTLPTPTVQDCSSQLTITANTPGLGAGLGPFTAGPGNYTTTFTANDGCGNMAVCTASFVVEDCKKPTPQCSPGLIIALMPGVPPMVQVNASSLNAGSTDNCPGQLLFSFSPNTNDNTAVFLCDDEGTNPVDLWVTDANGNQDFCTTTVTIQDNTNSCEDDTLVVNLGGFILNEDNYPIGSVNVQVSGQSNGNVATGANGSFVFGNVPIGQDITLLPSKDDNPLAGVSTYDLVLISKHVLDIIPLNSPYKRIAADVNNSKTITTFDIVELRKLILQMYDYFPNNNSWRFVRKDYTFPVPNNPWAEVFPELVNINDVPADVLDADFVAVKIGDLNNSSGLLQLESDDRTNEQVVFTAMDRMLVAGEEFTVDFNLNDDATDGYQFTLDIDQTALEFVRVGEEGLATDFNFGITKLNEGALLASWNNHGEAMEEKPAFSLVLRSKTPLRLSEALKLSDRFLRSEAYNGLGESRGLSLQFVEGELGGKFELFQNKPNPFSKETVIGFYLPADGSVKLSITDVSGRLVKLVEGLFQAGYNEVLLTRDQWAPSNGIYYYRLETGAETAIKKMVLTE